MWLFDCRDIVAGCAASIDPGLDAYLQSLAQTAKYDFAAGVGPDISLVSVECGWDLRALARGLMQSAPHLVVMASPRLLPSLRYARLARVVRHCRLGLHAV